VQQEGQTLSKKAANHLIDAAFHEPEELLKRLNGPLRTESNITLFFCNSCSPSQVKLLPEAYVEYPAKVNVGSDINSFKKDGERLQVESFLKVGQAQSAGVRTDWLLDLERTLTENPGKAPSLSKEEILAEPAKLLVLSDVTLVFTQPSPQKKQVFQGSGAADLTTTWKCPDLPGDVADFAFTTDGDAGDDPDKRWGVWAVVLPAGAKAPSQKAIDDLAAKWIEAVGKATASEEEVQVQREGWDETRLRALCARHGWEFEWMAEDSERRRRVAELEGGYFGTGAEAFKNTGKVIRTLRESNRSSLSSLGSGLDDEEASTTASPDPETHSSAGESSVLPDDAVESKPPERSASSMWKKVAASGLGAPAPSKAAAS